MGSHITLSPRVSSHTLCPNRRTRFPLLTYRALCMILLPLAELQPSRSDPCEGQKTRVHSRVNLAYCLRSKDDQSANVRQPSLRPASGIETKCVQQYPMCWGITNNVGPAALLMQWKQLRPFSACVIMCNVNGIFGRALSAF